MERITIVGLGLIGTSLGLALRQTKTLRAEIVGHDAEPSHAARAQRRGAVSKTSYNLLDAVDGARLVILAVPVMAIRETLELIAPHLVPGCVVTDTGSTKAEVLGWADSILRERDVSFVGGHPMAGKEESGPDAADAELFKGASYAVCPTSSASEEATRAIVTMIEAVGAVPYFVDAVEHDSYVAAVSHLPFLLSTALVASTTKSPAWREMSRLAATGYRDISRLAAGDPIMHRDICVTNSVGVVHWIDEFIKQLMAMREWIQEDHDALELSLINAWEARARWLAGQDSGERPGADLPKASESMMQFMMGDRLAQRWKQLSERSSSDPTKYRKR